VGRWRQYLEQAASVDADALARQRERHGDDASAGAAYAVAGGIQRLDGDDDAI
jgi:hypothetical protein